MGAHTGRWVLLVVLVSASIAHGIFSTHTHNNNNKHTHHDKGDKGDKGVRYVHKVMSRADPKCSTGVSSGNICCAKTCGHCGGRSCQELPGGPTNCCSSSIRSRNVSCTLSNPPCVLPPKPPPPIPSPSPVINAKRGYVADGVRSCDSALLLNVTGWFYGYNVGNPYRKSGLVGSCTLMNETAEVDRKFAPMNWCLDGIPNAIPNYVNRTFFMGFNEPNNLHNCNTDAEKAAASWKQVMTKWPNSQLVSPATSGNGISWFDAFFGNCTKMYGATGCNISYIAVHDYSCNPNSTLSYLKEIYDRYGKKVWLTEFSCGDHASGNPTAMHLQYMAEVIPMLDEAEYVYRYAWMSMDDSFRALINTASDGSVTLTEIGKLYMS